MLSCTDFIPAYSELFKFLHEKGGKQAVVAYWEKLADAFLGNLRDMVAQHGLAGCFEYWTHTLTEEAADFKMTLDEEAGKFEIIMRLCPSKGRLLESDRIEPYCDYCEHCAVLYPRILEPLGYQCVVDLSQCDQAKCSLTVRKTPDA